MAGSKGRWEDTIVALATPQGIGAIGVIRVSGQRAIEMAAELFPSKDLSRENSHTLHVGYLKENNKLLDEVVIGVYKTPKSYTGENVVEISGHGSPFILEQIIQAFIRKGARLAKPGEFTQRAFLNGKLDLTQAESVADLIASNTEASRNTALKNIRSGFSSALKELREQLIKFSALIELELDFSQEDVEFANRKQLLQLIVTLQQNVNELRDSFAIGNVIKNGVQVAIIGKPNAGKSTLLNTLLNENRAIVSDIAGTTRDTIEEILNIEGILFRLIDTAGIRQHTRDEIESIGVGRTFEKVQQADIVLYLYDRGMETKETLQPIINWLEEINKPFLLVANKSDLISSKEGSIPVLPLPEVVIEVSAKEGLGIEKLKKRILNKVIVGGIKMESTIVTNVRHYDALQKLVVALTDIRNGLIQQIPGDLLAIDIRRSLHFLSDITGEITNNDQLDYIFSKFCIGK